MKKKKKKEKKKKKRKTSQNYCHEKTGRRERRTLKKKLSILD